MNVRNGMRPVHPGEILRDEMEAASVSARALSRALDVPLSRVTMILDGRKGITADTALRLARTSARRPSSGSIYNRRANCVGRKSRVGPQVAGDGDACKSAT